MLTAQLLLQLIIILGTVQLAGYLCQRLGQQWVIGEIIAGLVLGPSFLGFFWPDLQILLFPTPVLPTLQSLGDLGLILYLFSLGSRTDTHLMLRQGSRAMIVSLSGILVPLIMGVALAFLLYPDFAGAQATPFSFIFLIGTSMAITAFPVLARLLAEKDLLKTRIGTLALTCAAVDDIVAWCLLAVVVALVQTRNLLSVLITVGLMMAFIMLMFGVV